VPVTGPSIGTAPPGSTPRERKSTAVTHPFLDLAPLSAAHFASIEDRVARLLGTEQDVVIMQGEALLPLEGAIRSDGGVRARSP
jgi:hypothetical protein